MAASRRRQVRLPCRFDEPLRQAGLGPADESTVLRALLILGLAHAGIAVEELRPDGLRLLAEGLSPQIAGCLAELYTERRTGVLQLYTERSTPPALPREEPAMGAAAAMAVSPAPLLAEMPPVESTLNPLDVGLEF